MQHWVRVYLTFMAIFAIIVALTPLTWTWFLSGLVVLALALYFYARDKARDFPIAESSGIM